MLNYLLFEMVLDLNSTFKGTIVMTKKIII